MSRVFIPIDSRLGLELRLGSPLVQPNFMDFDGNIKDDVTKLPTFAQWLKSTTAAQHKPIRIVRTVWMPNRFANLTFETEVFRLRVAEHNPLFKPLLSSIPSLSEEEKCLAIKVLDAESGEYRITVLEGESSTWEQLGESGYKLTVQDKKRTKREPK